ncbi:hypothetical protein AGMMS49942_15120 [Spirochaetia bacterium]|nr:hypothetical protein AGMMS49942_15120 [Spirochaetia bacterium]
MKKIIVLLVLSLSAAASTFAINPEDHSVNTPPNISSFALTEDRYKAESNRWSAFLLNLFPGFGTGSYIQGDLVGGIIGTVGEIAGVGIFVGGIIMNGGIDMSAGNAGSLMVLGGGALWVGTKIFESIKPFTYSNRLNFGMAPGFGSDGKIGLTAAMGFSF